MNIAMPFRFIFWSAIGFVGVIPFIGPIAVSAMVLARWYWTSISENHPSSGALRNIIYIFLCPLAVVGSINISSWIPMIFRAREISSPVLNSLEYPWINAAYPFVSKVLWLYTKIHDWINSAFNIEFRWMPEIFWAASSANDPTVTFEGMMKSWGAILPLFALVYVVLSFMSHLDVSNQIKRHRLQQAMREKQEKDQAEADERHVREELARIKAGGIPKMSNGKPSALDF